MTMFQRQRAKLQNEAEKLKGEAGKIYAETEEGADSILEKLKGKKWTAAALAGTALAAVFLLFK